MKEKIFHHDEFDIFFKCDDKASREAFEASFNFAGAETYINPAIATKARTEARDIVEGLSIARWGRGNFALLFSPSKVEAIRCRMYPLEFLIYGES